MGRGGADPFRTSRRTAHGAGAGEIDFVSPRAEVFGPSTLTTIPNAATSDAPTGPAFAEQSAADAEFGGDAPPWRPSTWVAALGVLALVGLGVVAAAPWQHDAPAAAPATTRPHPTVPPTTAPATSTPATTGAPADVGVVDGSNLPGTVVQNGRGYLLDLDAMDPADRPVLTGGYDSDPGQFFGDGWQAVWSEPGATRADGAWLIATLESGERNWGGQVRVQFGDHVGTAQTTADGVTTVQVAADTRTLTLTAHGWDEAGLRQLAAAARVDGDAVVLPADAIPPTQVQLFEGDGVMPISTSGPVRGDSWAAAWYTAAAGQITVFTSTSDVAWNQVMPLLSEGDGLSTGPSVIHRINGHDVVVSELSGWATTPVYVAEWSEGSTTVEVVGATSVAQALALVPVVHEGSQQEWVDVARATAPPADAPPEDTGQQRLDPIAMGTASSGVAWVVSVDSHATSAFLAPVTSGRDQTTGMAITTDDPIRVLAGRDLTWVTCLLPDAQTPRSMRITTDAGPVDVPFQQVGSTGLSFASYAFSELGQYRVHVDRLGTDPLDVTYGGAV